MGSGIRKCTCKHPYQDSLYGKLMRVMNQTVKREGVKNVYRCTVCGKETKSY